MWTKGKQLLCQAEEGGFIELGMNVRKSRAPIDSAFWPRPRPTSARSASPWTGAFWPPRFDLYCGRVSPSGSLELGDFTFEPGQHRIRFVSSGKNPASTGHFFGVDAVDLLPQE